MTTKSKRQSINNWLAARPERQVTTGKYATVVGYKYVTIISAWFGCKSYQMTLDEFIEKYVGIKKIF